jgi:hypothetical protein
LVLRIGRVEELGSRGNEPESYLMVATDHDLCFYQSSDALMMPLGLASPVLAYPLTEIVLQLQTPPADDGGGGGDGSGGSGRGGTGSGSPTRASMRTGGSPYHPPRPRTTPSLATSSSSRRPPEPDGVVVVRLPGGFSHTFATGLLSTAAAWTDLVNHRATHLRLQATDARSSASRGGGGGGDVGGGGVACQTVFKATTVGGEPLELVVDWQTGVWLRGSGADGDAAQAGAPAGRHNTNGRNIPFESIKRVTRSGGPLVTIEQCAVGGGGAAELTFRVAQPGQLTAAIASAVKAHVDSLEWLATVRI